MGANALIKQLFERYYGDGAAVPGLSSHWTHYSQKFDVRLGQNGTFDRLLGSGFGDMMLRNPLAKALMSIGIAATFVRQADKGSLLKLMAAARDVAAKMGAFYSFDCFKQTCALNLIEKHLPARFTPINVVIIGDGYGYLAGLIKAVRPHARVTLIDLGKTLLFQAHYLSKLFPDATHVEAGSPLAMAADFTFCPAEKVGKLTGGYDLAVNIASMQEMTPQIVDDYFAFLRGAMKPNGLFYCCNREEKVLPGGEILRMKDYPWAAGDRHLVDEVCPWYGMYMTSATTPKGPRVLGVRVPFVNYFDGRFFHRLTVLSGPRLSAAAAAGRSATQEA